MSEKNGQLWRNVRPILAPLCPVRVENPAHPGTPDVAHIYGWLELKWAPEWPKRASTPLRVEHFTTQQRTFLRDWNKHGGVADLLLQVGREYLFFSGPTAADVIGKYTRKELCEAAVLHQPSLSALRDGQLLRLIKTWPPQVQQ